MNKNRLLKMGACALVGAAIGFGIDAVVKKRKQKQVKEIKEVKEDKTPYVVAAVDTVVKIGCTVGAFYVFFKTLDYISEVDTKATVSNMLNIINGAKLGLIEKDVVEYMLKENAPSLDETSRALVRGYASSVFPDLVGGAIHE